MPASTYSPNRPHRLGDVFEPSPAEGLPKLGRIYIEPGWPGTTSQQLPGSLTLCVQLLNAGADLTPSDLPGDDPARLTDVLVTAAGPQRIDYSTGHTMDAEVARSFTPAGVAGRCRPADYAIDELGVVERLKLVQVTYETAALRLQTETVEPAELVAAAAAEEERVAKALRSVRERALKLVTAEIAASVKSLRAAQQAGESVHRLSASPMYRQLHDLYEQQARLAVLLSVAV